MNASEQGRTLALAQALASIGTVVRNYYPSASLNLSPWRDDPDTKKWYEEESLDFAFYFPGWSPKLQCRSLLMQLKVTQDHSKELPRLIGVIIRGITFHGESWRFVTVDEWQLSGSHLPEKVVREDLYAICRDLFALFSD